MHNEKDGVRINPSHGWFASAWSLKWNSLVDFWCKKFPITALREIKLLKMLSHPNILQLKEMAVERSKGKLVPFFWRILLTYDRGGTQKTKHVHGYSIYGTWSLGAFGEPNSALQRVADQMLYDAVAWRAQIFAWGIVAFGTWIRRVYLTCYRIVSYIVIWKVGLTP